MKQRLKHPIFILAITSLIYQILNKAGIKIELGMWQLAVDTVTYLLMGTGVYYSYPVPSLNKDSKVTNVKFGKDDLLK